MSKQNYATKREIVSVCKLRHSMKLSCRGCVYREDQCLRFQDKYGNTPHTYDENKEKEKEN